MPTRPSRSTLAVALFALAPTAATAASARVPDRRVVDVAEVGNARSDATHGYAGHDVIDGVVDGKPFRQARGWMHFALATFDDTEVTVACTFVAIDTVARRYDIVVEDSLIATRTFAAQPAGPASIEVTVPFSLTKGKSNIAVVIRARGGPTPALRELRTIQDHHEVDLAPNLLGATR